MELNASQKRALDTTRDILVSAGAGSGKTRVLVARFLHLLKNEPGLSMDNIVAITFTEKAAAELRERIHKELMTLHPHEVISKSLSTSAPFREELSSAYIGTVHSFCRRILGEFAFEAGVDADFRILDEDETQVLINEAIDFTLSSLSRINNQPQSASLEILLRYIGTGNLRSLLHDILSRRDIMIPHIRRFREWKKEELLKVSRNVADTILQDAWIFRESLESIHALCLKSIADVFELTLEEYEKRKGYGIALDFDDLLIKTVKLVETNSSICNQLRMRFRYFLVDEFQDTDPLQLQLFQILTGGSKPGSLFLVGDPKQSIYGFRRADVRLFYKAQGYIHEKNKNILPQADSKKCTTPTLRPVNFPPLSEDDFGLILLQENYRSDPLILDFVNYFFSRIMPSPNTQDMTSYDVPYEFLIAQKLPAKGNIEILFSDPDRVPPEHPFHSLPLEEIEAEFIALRLKELLMQSSPENLSPEDFALLLRSRSYLKSYEEALIRHDIPFVTLGGMGFYERQEVFDLANFLQCLLSPENDPALFGLLRSPFLRVPDSVIFQAAQLKKDSLWERIHEFIKEDSDIPEKLVLQRNVTLLERYIYESQRKPLASLLKEFLTETGTWSVLAGNHEGTRCLENVEKLFEQARQFDRSGFRSLNDFITELMSQIENAEKEGEAPQPETGLNAVKIMTIHKAKGLEFPVVILPGLSSSLRPLNAPFCIDETHGLGMILADPESNFEPQESSLFSALKEKNRQKQICEEKRLFYVGCTRAEKLLILSCTTPKRNKGETRQSWLNNVFNLEKAVFEEDLIRFRIDDRERIIPVYIRLPELQSGSHAHKLPKDSKAQTQKSSFVKPEDFPLPLMLPVPETSEKAVISVTSLNKFNQCALKYYLEDLLGWEKDVFQRFFFSDEFQKNIKGSGISISLARGIILHGLIEEFISLGNLHDEDLMICSSVDLESTLSKKERIDLTRDIKKSWDRIRKNKRINELIRLGKKYIELPFTISLHNSFLQGRVDLCFYENNRWSVLDFKTGFVTKDEKIAGKKEYEIQKQCYGLFLSVLAPDQEILPVYLFYVESNHNETTDFNRSEMESIRNRMEDLIQKEQSFREQFIGKKAVYGRDALNEILNRICPDCKYFVDHKCPCKTFKF